MKKLFFIFFAGLLFFVNAKPPKSNTSTTNNQSWVESTSIYGKWKWASTECCGKKKGITTPDSNEDNIFLELKSDNTFKETSNKHRIPRQGTIILTKTYKEDKSYTNMIQFNDERQAHYNLSKNGDTLILSWEYLELQKETYVRVK